MDMLNMKHLWDICIKTIEYIDLGLRRETQKRYRFESYQYIRGQRGEDKEGTSKIEGKEIGELRQGRVKNGLGVQK